MNKFIRHEACPKCQSSDALALYLKEHDRIQAHCFNCKYTKYDYNESVTIKPVRPMTKTFITLSDLISCPLADKSSRKITEETVRHFGIKATVDTTTGMQTAHFYPYYIKQELSGYKARVLPKDFSSIGAVGNIKGVDLFGQHLCTSGGYKLIITEGEEDCMAAYQMLYDYARSKGKDIKPNVVSLASGSGSVTADLERAKGFLSTFKEIILCFDQDKAGQQALAAAASLFDLNKFKVMMLTEKDASDMLTKGKEKEFISAFFNADTWKPGNIKNINTLEELILDRSNEVSTPYPQSWKILNNLTYGRRLGDLDVFSAGTGSGKSQVFKEMIYHDLMTTDLKIGCIALEESLKKSNQVLVGLHLNKRIHLPDVQDQVTNDEIVKAYRELAKDGRIEFYDQGRDMTDMTLLAQLRYMAAGLGCKHIYLDHLNMVISETASNGDERKRIDELMTKLKNIAKELNVWIGIIVHLSKTAKSSTPFELGAIPTVDDLRGSGSLKQLADTVIAVQRNGNHSSETMRDVLRLHVLKNRFSGRRGPADFLQFIQETGRIVPIDPPMYEILEPTSKKKFNLEDGEF